MKMSPSVERGNRQEVPTLAEELFARSVISGKSHAPGAGSTLKSIWAMTQIELNGL